MFTSRYTLNHSMGEASKPKYFTVFLRDLPVTCIDEVTDLVFEGGASGTEEQLAFSQPDLEYEAKALEAETTDMKIYFLRPPSLSLLAQIHNVFGCKVHIQEDEHRDWLEEWKKGFEPFALAADVWIVPNWREKPAAAKRAIFMEPGMAFGTGTHSTTRLAARILSEIKSEGRTLADIGTGTGILAMLADLLGFSDIVGNDIDPEARRTARKNIEHNRANVSVTDDDIKTLDGPFDVVLANIVDGVLVKLRDDLLRLVHSKGDLIVSGILKEREAQFLSRFPGQDLSVVARVEDEEWVAFHFRKS